MSRDDKELIQILDWIEGSDDMYDAIMAWHDKQIKKELGKMGMGWNDMITQVEELKVLAELHNTNAKQQYQQKWDIIQAAEKVEDDLRSKVKVLQESKDSLLTLSMEATEKVRVLREALKTSNNIFKYLLPKQVGESADRTPDEDIVMRNMGWNRKALEQTKEDGDE